MVGIVFLILMGIVCAVIHKRKGYSPISGFLWGIFFNILGLAVVLLEGNKEEQTQNGKKTISVGMWVLIFVAIGTIPIIFSLILS